MMSRNFGLNWAVLAAAAFLLAACAGSTEDPATSAEVATEAEETAGNGQPDAVTTPDVSSEELVSEGSIYGTATTASLISFAGSDRAYFAYDSSELSADARRTLDRQVEWLGYHAGVRIVVEGHCDERGTREYNLALGERRATAVRNYLTASGVSASRIRTISYGKERPAETGNRESVWRLNRRGVLVVQ